MPRITLYGMLQYDKTLFDGVVLPAGLNRDILINEIISRSGDLFPYYQAPPMLKINISYWFLRRRYDFEQMFKALTATYNPIENYDRHETSSRNYTNSGRDVTERKYTDENKRVDTTTLGTQTTTISAGESTEAVSAYNTNEYTNRNKTGNSRNDTTSNSGADKYVNSTNTSADDNSTVNYGAVRDETEVLRAHGNIGVTTNQEMISAEEDMRVKYDLYAMIAELFEHEFIVQIY